MKLSKNSKLLMSFFMKNNCINHISQTKNTDEITRQLYKEIIDSYNYLIDLKRVKKNNFYNISIIICLFIYSNSSYTYIRKILGCFILNNFFN